MAKAMKAMKAMAAMKAMRAMKKKSVSKIAKGRYAKVLVLRGSKEKTTGGLSASSLTKNKYGRVVSKKQSLRGKKNSWMIACQKARKGASRKRTTLEYAPSEGELFGARAGEGSRCPMASLAAAVLFILKCPMRK